MTLPEAIQNRKLHPTPLKVVTKKEMTFSKNPETACVVPVGTHLEVYFSENVPANLYFVYNGTVRATLVKNAHLTFKGPFKKAPSLATLSKWEWDDGICKTCTGHKTEPDGHGPDGSPSWMLVMGII